MEKYENIVRILSIILQVLGVGLFLTGVATFFIALLLPGFDSLDSSVSLLVLLKSPYTLVAILLISFSIYLTKGSSYIVGQLKGGSYNTKIIITQNHKLLLASFLALILFTLLDYYLFKDFSLSFVTILPLILLLQLFFLHKLKNSQF